MVRKLLGVCIVLMVGGCSPSEPLGSGDDYARGGGRGAEGPPAVSDGAAGGLPTEGAADPGTTTGGPQPGSGQLTAGMWDDNDNFDWFVSYRDGLQQQRGMPPFTPVEQEAAKAAAQQRTARTSLEVAFVLDTTGSMGDELRYLVAEIEAIAANITAGNPNVDARWGLVAYRDKGDSYLVQGHPFQSSVPAFQSELAKLSAGGGGDTPEAPDAALKWAADALQWSTGANVARIVFWVADAPHHEENAQALVDAVRSLRGQDIRIYPIASSGIDELTEYTMRASAQVTGGRYLFLTDDSGIGNPHKEPSIPCYFVTRLDQAIVRSVQSELRGTWVAPAESEIIRSVGDPQDGVCTLQDRQARAY